MGSARRPAGHGARRVPCERMTARRSGEAVDAGSVGGGEDADAWTGAIGAEVRPFDAPTAFRAAHGTDLGDNRTLFGRRWTFSAVDAF